MKTLLSTKSRAELNKLGRAETTGTVPASLGGEANGGKGRIGAATVRSTGSNVVETVRLERVELGLSPAEVCLALGLERVVEESVDGCSGWCRGRCAADDDLSAVLNDSVAETAGGSVREAPASLVVRAGGSHEEVELGVVGGDLLGLVGRDGEVVGCTCTAEETVFGGESGGDHDFRVKVHGGTDGADVSAASWVGGYEGLELGAEADAAGLETVSVDTSVAGGDHESGTERRELLSRLAHGLCLGEGNTRLFGSVRDGDDVGPGGGAGTADKVVERLGENVVGVIDGTVGEELDVERVSVADDGLDVEHRLHARHRHIVDPPGCSFDGDLVASSVGAVLGEELSQVLLRDAEKILMSESMREKFEYMRHSLLANVAHHGHVWVLSGGSVDRVVEVTVVAEEQRNQPMHKRERKNVLLTA